MIFTCHDIYDFVLKNHLYCEYPKVSFFSDSLCTRKLDNLGCHVFAGCLTEKGEVELKKACTKRVVPVRLDVTNHESIVKAYEEIERLLPKEKGEETRGSKTVDTLR